MWQHLAVFGMQSWATSTDEALGSHLLRHLVASVRSVDSAVAWAASVVPGEYVDPARMARILTDAGKPVAAAYLKDKLPCGKKSRSGDLGEILGKRFVTDELGYRATCRLRWKDHREMAMRGDDIIGVRTNATGTVEFLKGEVKSRAQLKTATVVEADRALRSDMGRPSPHALAFVADRLDEQGEEKLARAIINAQLVQGIASKQVKQLLFTFTGSDPRNLLRTNTQAYRGAVRRLAVGLQVPDHQGFVARVYAEVIADA